MIKNRFEYHVLQLRHNDFSAKRFVCISLLIIFAVSIFLYFRLSHIIPPPTSSSRSVQSFLLCAKWREALNFISMIFCRDENEKNYSWNFFHVTFIKWAWRGFLNRILRRKKSFIFPHFYVKTQMCLDCKHENEVIIRRPSFISFVRAKPLRVEITQLVKFTKLWWFLKFFFLWFMALTCILGKDIKMNIP